MTKHGIVLDPTGPGQLMIDFCPCPAVECRYNLLISILDADVVPVKDKESLASVMLMSGSAGIHGGTGAMFGVEDAQKIVDRIRALCATRGIEIK